MLSFNATFVDNFHMPICQYTSMVGNRVDFHPSEVAEILFFSEDLKKAEKWYTELIGHKPDVNSLTYVSYDLGRVRIGLHPGDGKGSPGVAGQVAYWSVNNLEDALHSLLGKGCSLYRGPATGAEGHMICQVIDPFGNAWGLSEVH